VAQVVRVLRVLVPVNGKKVSTLKRTKRRVKMPVVAEEAGVSTYTRWLVLWFGLL
jgi:hypothetical protein